MRQNSPNYGNRSSSHDKGDVGEDVAASYLRQKGFEIIARNWRIAGGELDIVARKDNIIAFVEVKTAYNLRYGNPLEWVNKAKQRQIGKMASMWIEKMQPQGCFFRFDVIALIKQDSGFSVCHVEDAFSL